MIGFLLLWKVFICKANCDDKWKTTTLSLYPQFILICTKFLSFSLHLSLISYKWMKRDISFYFSSSSNTSYSKHLENNPLLQYIQSLIAAARKRPIVKRFLKICQKLALQLVTCQDFSLVESVNITADSSSIAAFSVSHQILTIPQAELLARAHWIRREGRQDNLRGERVISGNPGPLYKATCELTRRQNDLTAGCCYDGINVVFYDGMVATAPERPVGKNAGGTRHVTT